MRPDRAHSSPLDTVLEADIIEEEATSNSHRLYLRLIIDGAPTDCVFESELADHPYEVTDVAGNRRWHLALPIDKTVAIPMTSQTVLT